MPAGRHNWQNDLTLTESNRYMLNNHIDCDVWFTLLPSGGAAAGEELPVTVGSHRYVLVSRSPVFFAMLSSPLASTSGARNLPSPSPSQHRRQQQQQQRAARHDEQTGDAASSTRPKIRITDIAPSMCVWYIVRIYFVLLY